MTCEHSEREWLDENHFIMLNSNEIGIKTKCNNCNIVGVEVYSFVEFAKKELIKCR